MSDKLFVKPAKGLLVRDPVSLQPLPEQGRVVPRDSHWMRRLKAGDVVETTEKAIHAVQTKAQTSQPATKGDK